MYHLFVFWGLVLWCALPSTKEKLFCCNAEKTDGPLFLKQYSKSSGLSGFLKKPHECGMFWCCTGWRGFINDLFKTVLSGWTWWRVQLFHCPYPQRRECDCLFFWRDCVLVAVCYPARYTDSAEVNHCLTVLGLKGAKVSCKCLRWERHSLFTMRNFITYQVHSLKFT